MPNMKQIGFVSVLVLALLSTATAQDGASTVSQKSSLTITANVTGDRVRVTAPSSVVQLHLEVYASSGEKLFDQEIRGGNVFDWHLQDGQAQRLAPGAYVCVVTAKSVSGRITQKLGTVTVAEKSASVQAGSLQLSLQQSQAIGPVEADSSWTIAGENEPQTPTVIANDGTDGQMIRGRGALTFRVGNFFSGIDTEQMRLTEAGDLGIGTPQPQSRLDVVGTIRAQRFLVVKPNLGNGDKTATGTQALDSGDSVQPLASGAGTQNRIAKWIDNIGTLGDSGITETAGGNIGIGTTSPAAKLHLSGGNGTGLPTAGATMALGFSTTGQYPQFITTVHDTAAANNEINFYTGDGTAGGTFPANAVLGMTIRNGQVGIATRSPAAVLDVFGGAYNSGIRIGSSSVNGAGVSLANSGSGGKTYDIISTGSSNSPGAGLLAFYDESLGYVMSLKGGNVGIGTSVPSARLDVTGDINTNTQYKVGGAAILSIAGDGNLFAGASAGTHNTSGFGNSFFGPSAGFSNTAGVENSFFGASTGLHNTTGTFNSFFGASAGLNNTTGGHNSFFGADAGFSNTTGDNNSFFGFGAGQSNTLGDNNSYLGASANSVDGLQNATAVGSQAFVTLSNSLVLGSINGQNGATADTNVGIGTPAPTAKLDVNGAINVQDSNNKTFFGGLSTEVSTQMINFGMNDSRFGGSTTSAQGGFLRLDTRGGRNLFQFLGRAAGSTGSVVELMDISAAGDVGIGTTAPARHLHVFGPGDQEIAIESSDTSGRQWTLQSSRGAFDGRLEIIDRTANANRFTILSNGNVGIGGVTGPGVKLHVGNGDVAITTQGNGLILHATNGGNCFRVTVNDNGDLSTTHVNCP